ncbi:DUF3545 family protein [Psychromonas sp. PT13]|uniref:DUF3545 family protein n=1 Tax=Psychromonas sp. PT13 TaxID=3439547 RepID=UPI003EBD7A4B
MQIVSDDLSYTQPTKKASKVRKWREIEALKARNQLSKELQDIDQSFKLSVTDFF